MSPSLERDSAAAAALAAPTPVVSEPLDERALAYESGLDLEVRSQWTYARRRFIRHRLAVAGLVVLVLIFGAGLLAPWIAPHSFEGYDVGNVEVGPTLHGGHVFGTDLLGRDYFSRVLYGIRTSERVAFTATILALFIGVGIGMLAGYYSRYVDNVLMRLTDLVLTLPPLAVLLVIAALLGKGDQDRVAVILALLSWTLLARIVRAQFLSLREKDYVEAAKAAGASDLRIMFRHMLPNSIGAIAIFATLTLGGVILFESYLSFLGFGVQPPTPALGKLISDGQAASSHDWWLVAFPGLTIVVIVLCINFVGDGLRDALDPTQRIRS